MKFFLLFLMVISSACTPFTLDAEIENKRGSTDVYLENDTSKRSLRALKEFELKGENKPKPPLVPVLRSR